MGPVVWAAAIAAAAPIAARDGEKIEADGALAFGLVGGLATASDAVLDDLRAADLQFVVLADAVERGTPVRYAALQARLGTLPVEPMPGAGEARGDRRLRAFAEAWQGLGVRPLADPVPWRSFELCSAGQPWRVVMIDADRDRLGAAFWDEMSWLPKVLADGDAPVLILSNRPVGSLAAAAWSAGGAKTLHDVAMRHTAPTRLVLYAATGGATPEFTLPGGRWGEGWLGIGRVARPVATLRRDVDHHVLEPGLDAALVAWFAGVGDATDLEAGADFTADRHPVAGWWRISLDGSALVAELRMEGPTGWATVHELRWTADTGWTSVGPPPVPDPVPDPAPGPSDGAPDPVPPDPFPMPIP